VSDIFQEVQEEYRREQISQAWTKYRIPLIGAAAAMVLAVAAYQGWSYWYASQVEASSRQFEAASSIAENQAGQEAAAAASFGKLANDGAGGYPFTAKLQEAALRAAAGDAKGAVALYDRIADDSSDHIFADYARVRAAILLVETAPLAEIKKRLDPIAASESPWRISAEEFLGYAHWRAGDKKEALRLFDLIKSNPQASEGTKRRATELSALINGGTTVAELKAPATLAPSPASGLPTIPGMPTFDTPPVTPVTPPEAPTSPSAPTPTP
jgi:hypothetical protein